jgi:threonine dehydrogenase-like Zn-dependent dehydrogenase
MHGAGDVRIEDVPDPAIRDPADVIVRVARAAICGSDLHPYRAMAGRESPQSPHRPVIPHAGPDASEPAGCAGRHP